MTAHEKEFGKESQRVQAWRSALSEAANLPGMHITPVDIAPARGVNLTHDPGVSLNPLLKKSPLKKPLKWGSKKSPNPQSPLSRRLGSGLRWV
ncbi:uncharacterized protein HKW66_Vig0133180 [Vigna angularis]|uniref:TIR domain-containing protein n=1 Tax=Phaseolus angularis TaxID=3914 RepID=A0A8T0K1E3_PHAAN|nr:uncharacterized protein HKW66_Vig0133180 [Vigna angularis]